MERHDKLHEAIRYTERERDTALSEKVALEGIVEGLVRAITEHRTAIHNAGTIKVQPGYEQVAEAKHRADNRLWSALDG